VNITEDLRKWVKEKWVDIGSPDGKGGYKPCGRSEGEKRSGYPKCVPAAKASQMTKKEKTSAVRRKRAKPNDGGKPDMVKTIKEHVIELIEKKLCAKGKAAAKRKYDVYPSAYANMYASAVCSGKVKLKEDNGQLSLAGMYRGANAEKPMSPYPSDFFANQNIANKHREYMLNSKVYRDAFDTQMPGDHNSAHHLAMKAVLGESTNKVSAPTGYHWMKHGKDKYKLMKHAPKTFKPHDNASVEAKFDVQKFHEATAAWTRKEGKNSKGGLNAKGRKSYEKANPGSDLKAPVSAEQAKKSKGGKAAKRRKSFCARMGGMPGAMKDKNGKPTRKALALRKWDC